MKKSIQFEFNGRNNNNQNESNFVMPRRLREREGDREKYI